VCTNSAQCSIYGVQCQMNAGLQVPPGRGVCQ
jgi:hypothetical protein